MTKYELLSKNSIIGQLSSPIQKKITVKLFVQYTSPSERYIHINVDVSQLAQMLEVI